MSATGHSSITFSSKDDRYSFKFPVSEGAYGVVYKASDKTTGNSVAIKKIKTDKLDSPSSEGISATTIREISLLKETDHPNIIRLLDVVVDKRVWLVFEWANASLKKHLEELQAYLSPDKIQDYTLQIVQAMKYLHSVRIIHRDLKADNILVMADGTLKVADFGLGRTVSFPMRCRLTTEVVTLWYRAPEVIIGDEGRYTMAIDMFSVGCIFAEIATKKPLFPSTSEVEHVKMIFKLNGTPTPATWPELVKFDTYEHIKKKFPQYPGVDFASKFPQLSSKGIDLLHHLIANRPEVRLSAKASKDHPYFDEDFENQTPETIGHAQARQPARIAFADMGNKNLRQRRRCANDCNVDTPRKTTKISN